MLLPELSDRVQGLVPHALQGHLLSLHQLADVVEQAADPLLREVRKAALGRYVRPVEVPAVADQDQVKLWCIVNERRH